MTAHQNFLRTLAWLAVMPTAIFAGWLLLGWTNSRYMLFWAIPANLGILCAWVLFRASAIPEAASQPESALGPFARKLLSEFRAAQVRVGQSGETVWLTTLPSLGSAGSGLLWTINACLLLMVAVGWTLTDIRGGLRIAVAITEILMTDVAFGWWWVRLLTPEHIEFTPEVMRIRSGPWPADRIVTVQWRHVHNIRLQLRSRRGQLRVVFDTSVSGRAQQIEIGRQLEMLDKRRFSQLIRNYRSNVVRVLSPKEEPAGRVAAAVNALRQFGDGIAVEEPPGEIVIRILSRGPLGVPGKPQHVAETWRLTPTAFLHQRSGLVSQTDQTYQWSQLRDWSLMEHILQPQRIDFQHCVTPHMGQVFGIAHDVSPDEAERLLELLEAYQEMVVPPADKVGAPARPD